MISAKFFLSFAIAGLFASPAFATQPGDFEKIEISTCSRSGAKCLKINAEKATGANMADLLSFKDAAIAQTENGKTKKWFATRGYIDFANNQIVITVDSDRDFVEKAFEITSLSEQVYRTGK